MNPPAVSVLIPFRNAEEYIHQALESVASQTLEDFEAVMVDDGSVDGSGAIAGRWCGKDRRFRLMNCNGRGLVDALSTGLASCRGTWVARMDADDLCLPERLERQLEMAGECGPRTVVTCRIRSFPPDRVTNGFRVYEEWINALLTPEEIERNLFVESPVPHPTAFYHRESIIGEGGYAERELPEDYELWLRLWSRGYRFRRVPEILLMWRDRPERLSRTSSAYSLTSFYRLKARYLEKVPCMSGKRVFVAGSGQSARRLGKFLERRGFIIEAFLGINDGEKGRTLRGRPVITSSEFTPVRGVPVVIASRQHGARRRIREFLQELGLEEWEDFVACS